MGDSNLLSSMVYSLLPCEYNSLTDGLQRLLGDDLCGPSWVVCTCGDCQRRASEIGHTRLPGTNLLDDDRTTALVWEIVSNRKFR